MSPQKLAASALCVLAMPTLCAMTPVSAGEDRTIVMDGRCQYTDEAAKYRNETILILCDRVRISRTANIATLDFSRRSWGPTARFTGDMPANIMTVSQIRQRSGRSVAATGRCEIFYRNDGEVAVISCLARFGSRSIAVNFIPSRI